MNNVKPKIVALVVTFNRKELLIECLLAILNQSSPVDEIVVIDNNSSDGTDELFNENYFQTDKITYQKLASNLGGAGGFYEGIKYIINHVTFDWLWLMDDDTIAQKNTVANALQDVAVLPANISFLASSVYGPDNEPMNVPVISNEKSSNGYKDWYRYLEHGVVQIAQATFVSLFINQEAIKTVGLPIKEYFIWGDDTEYTRRLIAKYGPAYFSGSSQVLHKRFNAKPLSLVDEENEQRVAIYQYYYRNTLLNAKKYVGKQGVLKEYLINLRDMKDIAFKKEKKHKVKKINAILMGTKNYWFSKL
ncbi:MAG: glycosyltransferase [Enterococcus sp.]